MKLLIVDDEALTLNGLLTSISWESLGITEVFQADDGLNGLSVALKNKPEIILCDIRMPRMDGIHMAEKLQKELPNTSIIFMSGYSDKEYLKAAIKLKAMNYVEKPLDPEEIKDAVLDSMENYRHKINTQNNEILRYKEDISRLTRQLTYPFSDNREDIRQLCNTLRISDAGKALFTCILIKFGNDILIEDEQSRIIYNKIETFLKKYNISTLMTKRHQNYLVFFIYSYQIPSAKTLAEIIEYFHIILLPHKNYYICCSSTVKGISNAYNSYAEAVTLMQSSFFFDNNSLLTFEILKRKKRPEDISSFFSQDISSDFSEALSIKNHENCILILTKLYSFFYQNTDVFSNHAKDLYYKLFTVSYDMRKKIRISGSLFSESEIEIVISYIEKFNTYIDLHKALEEKTDQYFFDIKNQTSENSTVFLIKQYIRENYQNELLSVKDISDHVYLSVSYICTLFKLETGKTLNQYITEFRIEKAKKLLNDSRNKILDISSKVGYSDGNYFSKSFKKYVGVSPSEYREKMLG